MAEDKSLNGDQTAPHSEDVNRRLQSLDFDLRNRLVAVAGYVELLREKLEPTHPAYQYVAPAQECAERCVRVQRMMSHLMFDPGGEETAG